MPSEDTKVLEFNQYQKSGKAPFIIYADFKCLIDDISFARKRVSIMYTILLFKRTENKHDACTSKHWMKMFFEPLREYSMKIISFKKKKWSYEQTNSRYSKISYICKKKLENKHAADKKMSGY